MTHAASRLIASFVFVLLSTGAPGAEMRYALPLVAEGAVSAQGTIPRDRGIAIRMTPKSAATVAAIPGAIDPHHHFNFGGDFVWEYHTEDGLSEEQRFTRTRLGAGDVVYDFFVSFDNATNMYDVVTDRIYLKGSKSIDGGATWGTVLAVFDPHTQTIERERVLTEDEVASGKYTSTWDVCGNYWWTRGVLHAISTETLEDAFDVDPGTFGDGYGPAWPHGVLVFDSDNYANSGWKRITVTGPTTFDEDAFELGAGNTYGSANDGGYQRPYIIDGNKMFLYVDPSSGGPNLGYIVDVATLAVSIVTVPDDFDTMKGAIARYDPKSNAILLQGSWTPADPDNFFGSGSIVIDVASATVRSVLGGDEYGDYIGSGSGGFNQGGRPDGEGFAVLWGAFPADFSRGDTGIFDVTATGRVVEATRIAGQDYPLPVLDPPIDSWSWFYAITSFPLVIPGTPGTAALPLKTFRVSIKPPA